MVAPQESSPRVAVDIVVFTLVDGQLSVLLVRRGIPPFKGRWALPGGFVLRNETLDDAARRELREETGVDQVYVEQLYTFGAPHRDPRGRVISVAYMALVPRDRLALTAGSDAAEAQLVAVDRVGELAFDHAEILRTARERLRNKLDYTTLAFQLVPRTFTLSEVQSVYEAVLGHALDKRNFRRRLAWLDVIEATGRKRSDGYRPAELYRLRRHASMREA